MAKELKLITAMGADPGVLDALIGGAKKNRAAQTKRQSYDGQRIRVRVDVPEPVRDLLREVAGELATSVNDLAKTLLMYALARYYEGDLELEELIESSKSFSTSPKKTIQISDRLVLDRLQNAVAKATKDVPSAEIQGGNGADGGADEWGEWLNA